MFSARIVGMAARINIANAAPLVQTNIPGPASFMRSRAKSARICSWGLIFLRRAAIGFGLLIRLLFFWRRSFVVGSSKPVGLGSDRSGFGGVLCIFGTLGCPFSTIESSRQLLLFLPVAAAQQNGRDEAKQDQRQLASAKCGCVGHRISPPFGRLVEPSGESSSKLLSES